MKVVTFIRKNGDTAKRVVDFPLERDTFRNKIMEIVGDFDENSYNINNGKNRLSFFIIFLHFFVFHFFIFHICNFSFSFFHFFLCSFSSFSFHFLFYFHFHFHFHVHVHIHFLSFSFMFFHFLTCSLSEAQNLIFFWASISLRFLLTIRM